MSLVKGLVKFPFQVCLPCSSSPLSGASYSLDLRSYGFLLRWDRQTDTRSPGSENPLGGSRSRHVGSPRCCARLNSCSLVQSSLPNRWPISPFLCWVLGMSSQSFLCDSTVQVAELQMLQMKALELGEKPGFWKALKPVHSASIIHTSVLNRKTHHVAPTSILRPTVWVAASPGQGQKWEDTQAEAP